jgi:[protein-PII] uridylyltransferase
LDLLHALTEADAAATGPAAWSDWKQALIDDLVLRTRSVLAGQDVPAPPRTTTAQRAVAAAMTAVDAEGIQVLMTGNPDSAMATVVVAAPDRTGLLSVVAGVLALHRLQVRAAQVDTVTTEQGARAIQVWSVLPYYGEPPAVDRLREDITRALAGSLDVRGRLALRELSYAGGKHSAPPRVDLVPAASQRATVVEVRAHDLPGLLHRVAGVIAVIEGSIVAARVATLGSEVVDVFYVVGPDGTRLTGDREEELRRTVLAELTGVPLPDSA